MMETSGRLKGLRTLGALLCLLAIGGALVAYASQGDAVTDSVPIEAPGGGSGASPFTSDLRRAAESSRRIQTEHSGRVGGLQPGVSEPLARGACDVAELMADLRADPARSDAWTGVLGITAGQLDSYVFDLRPAVLVQDVIVLNHAYIDSRAQPVRTVLEAGNLVLVDSDGVPRVLCKCGNPLLETPPTSEAISVIAQPTATPRPTATPPPTVTPTATPTLAPTTTPTTTPTVTPISTPTTTPTPTVTPIPVAPPTPTLTPTATPTEVPASTPTPPTLQIVSCLSRLDESERVSFEVSVVPTDRPATASFTVWGYDVNGIALSDGSGGGSLGINQVTPALTNEISVIVQMGDMQQLATCPGATIDVPDA